ncbi:hypothetical protein BV25DRAFT_1827561 [Artomyces pyxidatus]|uniref:Uncharacterized protein n=1 Tax=Artomyces pyxidatus TaxID=48021 RepID=A0ACB8SXW5_9AGAM|nr:hypothetical protein BV25DRAFT_1827561 [Artomyces pyxidatus]
MPQFAASNTTQMPTNGLFVSTNRDDVTGTWCLDPLLPTQIRVSQREDKTQKRHGAHRVESSTLPSAVFDSRHGNLNATLAIVGTPQPARAGIVATTRHGHVKINLTSKAPGKSVDIDVYSRHGEIVVLLPRSFVGVLELRARRGNILTMSNLASVAQVVQSTDDKVVLRLGQGVQVPAGIPEDHGRFYTRSGNISVGFSGEDDSHALPPPSAARTMLKKMTGF